MKVTEGKGKTTLPPK